MLRYFFIYIYIIICRKANNWSLFLWHVLYFIEQLWGRSLCSVWSSNAARITTNMDIKIIFSQEFPTQVSALWYSVFGLDTTSLWTAQSMLKYQLILWNLRPREYNFMLYLKSRFLWCWHLDILLNKSETPWNFSNVVLEKDVENQLKKYYIKSRWKGTSYVQ